MTLKLTPEIVKRMLVGSSIYSTGGGFELGSQRKMFSALFDKKARLELVSIDELGDDDYVCTAYGVGSTSNTDFDLSEAMNIGLRRLEEITGKRFKAIFAGETNIDILAFQAASGLNLPVLDGDCTGGRAVPEITFDNFLVAGISLLPSVVVDMKGNITIVRGDLTGEEIERRIRKIAVDAGTSIAVLDHSISVRDARKVLTLGIFERAIKAGEFIEKNRGNGDVVDLLAKRIGARKVIEGRITKVSFKDSGGFLESRYTVSDGKDMAEVYVKNENIILWLNGRMDVEPPDSIITVDKERMVGVHNSRIRKGVEVAVLALEATELWRSPRARNAFSKKSFGL